MIKDNQRILLVEDHPFQRLATQYLLESFGFTQVITTDCAQGALQEMLGTEQPFDLLLCDQCLPDMCGIDLVKLGSRLGMIKKAILLSSLTPAELHGIENKANSHQLPLLGCLTKPLKQSDFIKLLTTTPQKDGYKPTNVKHLKTHESPHQNTNQVKTTFICPHKKPS